MGTNKKNKNAKVTMTTTKAPKPAKAADKKNKFKQITMTQAAAEGVRQRTVTPEYADHIAGAAKRQKRAEQVQ